MIKPRDCEGGCLCGAVRYRVVGAPLWVENCHCSMCRKASGAAFVTWAAFNLEHFRFVKGKPASFASSAKAVRQFCSHCGSALTFKNNARPDKIDVTVGTMDRPNDLRPTAHIWTSSQITWIKLADGLPCHAESGGEVTAS